MKTLTATILENNSFVFEEKINGFHKDMSSFFFIEEIRSEELKIIKDKSTLDNCDWYKKYLESFSNTCKSTTYSALEKNSSLIILVQANDITEIQQLQSQILLIEEDRFFVKKYIIVYTSGSLAKIRENKTNAQLQSELNNQTAFLNILNNGFTSDNEDYILVLQLFIKLPFLVLNFSEDQFTTLLEKLKINLDDDYSTVQYLVNNGNEINQLDFLDPKESMEESINKLIKELNYD